MFTLVPNSPNSKIVAGSGTGAGVRITVQPDYRPIIIKTTAININMSCVASKVALLLHSL
jgi:hypothetical protein